MPIRKNIFTCLLLLLSSASLHAQELFIQNEPASSIPKGTLGIRLYTTAYDEQGTWRHMFAPRVMYGLTPRLTVMATGSISNHHGRDLPQGLAFHTHDNNGRTNNQTGQQIKGLEYPYLFNGVNFYAKYRFFTHDRQNTHLRIAAFAEAALLTVAHDEAEPNLADDTRGYGGGFIVTYLHKRFAISLTSGFIIPGSYTGTITDTASVPPEPMPTTVHYGRALTYNLSLGYLVYPHKYKSYNQVNWNIYLELMGKSYETARIYQTNAGIVKEMPIQTPLLREGHYIEAHPGIQCIIRSNLRLDLSVGFPVVNRSYARYYPYYLVGVQRYFYSLRRNGK